MNEPRRIALEKLDLSEFIRPGDWIIPGQATGEPTALTEALCAQRYEFGPARVFLGFCPADTFKPEHADQIAFHSFGPMGYSRALADAGLLEVHPVHYGLISHYIDGGQIPCDVALVLLSPPGPDGRHSFGLINDYIRTAMAKARVVIAEVNDQVPWVYAEGVPEMNQIDVIVETSGLPVTVPAARSDPIDESIAANVARYIEDGSILQIGMGSVPDAVARLIRDRRDLGFHSGMASDFLVDLVESGVMTNARKTFDRGISVAATLLGHNKLYPFVKRNPVFKLRPSWHTHAGDVLRVERLVSVNSALEVDLTGQVGAEEIGGKLVSAIGGQADLVRIGHRSLNGHAVIALPSTARGGTVSRIVNRLSGPVTTPRSDVDVVVTEHGSADLRGLSLVERKKALIRVANPAHRDVLEEFGSRE